MSTQTATPHTSAPDGPELLRRVRALRELVEAEAPAAEAEGRLTERVVDAMHEAGVYRMWVPRALGGSELRPREIIAVLEELAHQDGSTGWVAMASSMSTGSTAAYLPDDVSADLFKPGERIATAGQGTKPGKAVPEGDGYRLSGDWLFGSGIQHASHVHSLAIDESTGTPLIFTTPIDDADLDRGSWDVMGLRATGSLDYRMRDLHVPREWTHPAFAKDGRRGDFYRLGIMNMAAICHVAWALGAGRRALDELADMVRAKRGRAGSAADSDAFLQGYAEIDSRLRAARAWAMEVWGEVEDTIYGGEDLSTRQESLTRALMPHVTFTARDAVQFAYRHGGTTALRAGTLQRLVRDMHAATQHITASPAGQTEIGRELAGLAEDRQWVLMNLVPAEA